GRVPQVYPVGSDFQSPAPFPSLSMTLWLLGNSQNPQRNQISRRTQKWKWRKIVVKLELVIDTKSWKRRLSLVYTASSPLAPKRSSAKDFQDLPRLNKSVFIGYISRLLCHCIRILRMSLKFCVRRPRWETFLISWRNL
ncbi:unnamed protein product, partial [Lactuca virosa]